MSAYSFVNHRMFVAALGNDVAMPRAVERRDARPTHTAGKDHSDSIPRVRASSAPGDGVLLANAMLHGYQPTAS